MVGPQLTALETSGHSWEELTFHNFYLATNRKAENTISCLWFQTA